MEQRYVDTLKTKEQLELERFFGYIKKSSTNFFKFKQVYKNGDTIIVLTNNICRYGKTETDAGKPIMMITENAAIFLQDWQFRKVSSKRSGLKCFAVKLNRQNFKPYVFKGKNESFIYPNDGMDYNTWMRIAIEQEEQKYVICDGWPKENS